MNTHLGIEQSRRDDLEAIGYVLVYFLKGSLPWQGLRADNKKMKYEKISEKKLSTTVEELCSGLPGEFVTFISYCKGLHFEAKPDYAYLRKLLRSLFVREGYKYDGVYDWTLMKSSAAAAATAAGGGAVPGTTTTAAGGGGATGVVMTGAATGAGPQGQIVAGVQPQGTGAAVVAGGAQLK